MNMHLMLNDAPYTHRITDVPAGGAVRKQAQDRLTENLSRLICALVVSPRFCQLLLSDPVSALGIGFNGERFHLTSEEVRIVCSIQATSLRDFATQLVERMQVAVAEARTPWTAEYAFDAAVLVRTQEFAPPVSVAQT